jgi:DNA-binding transcriptional MerR regulator
MDADAPPLWTIHQLVERVVEALSGDYQGAANGRVRDVPDLRTTRYYTTLGLLDRPIEMRGRAALYGPRHLLQLVAIKKLQARGLSLAQVQERLAGATDVTLRELAGAVIAPGESPHAPVPAIRDGTRRFWKSRPAAVSPRVEDSSLGEWAQGSGTKRIIANRETRVLQAIALANDVTLLLPSDGVIDPEQVAAIREAAAPLIHFLNEHGLIQPPSKGEGDEHPASPDR